jgi:RNA polymerase sigma-70 factor (ECF subfamily)
VEDTPPAADDLSLTREAARGDGRAFHALVDRHGPRLLRLARALCGNAADAEDALQETFLGAFRNLPKFEGRSSVRTWLSRILVTQVALLRRRGGRHRHLSLDAGDPNDAGDWRPRDAVAGPVPSGGPSPTGDVDWRVDLDGALSELSAEHREVVVLRELEGLSYEEIARVLGVPRGTVESRLHRARAELRQRLGAYRR